ncbi:MAG: PEP-CTERM sorting domain-containing protein [Chlorobaculum sp.]|jgi:hypothetical protein|nr:PEP-CTERM sorting domain-containing protein [Chlorobaculum sp.]
MKATAFLLGSLFTTFAWSGANAAVISANSITGTNPSADDPYVTGISSDPNITASGIGRSTGISAATASNRYSSRSWSTGAFDATDYFTFTLDANDGYEINFDDFFYTGTASASGPTAFAFRSSLDGFASDIGTPTATGATISLTAPQFQHLTTPIEFRLYGYTAGGGAGTFSINDYSFNGTVNGVDAIPEPSTLALLGAGALLMFGNQRHTRKQLETAE